MTIGHLIIVFLVVSVATLKTTLYRTDIHNFTSQHGFTKQGVGFMNDIETPLKLSPNFSRLSRVIITDIDQKCFDHLPEAELKYEINTYAAPVFRRLSWLQLELFIFQYLSTPTEHRLCQLNVTVPNP